MKYEKPVRGLRHQTGTLTVSTFVRAAAFATLIVIGACALSFLVQTVAFSSDIPLLVGFVMLPLLMLAIWVIAAVLGTLFLLPKGLFTRVRDQSRRKRHRLAPRTGLWDDWLDGPVNHERF
jgi:hypothetical protein